MAEYKATHRKNGALLVWCQPAPGGRTPACLLPVSRPYVKGRPFPQAAWGAKGRPLEELSLGARVAVFPVVSASFRKGWPFSRWIQRASRKVCWGREGCNPLPTMLCPSGRYNRLLAGYTVFSRIPREGLCFWAPCLSIFSDLFRRLPRFRGGTFSLPLPSSFPFFPFGAFPGFMARATSFSQNRTPYRRKRRNAAPLRMSPLSAMSRHDGEGRHEGFDKGKRLGRGRGGVRGGEGEAFLQKGSPSPPRVFLRRYACPCSCACGAAGTTGGIMCTSSCGKAISTPCSPKTSVTLWRMEEAASIAVPMSDQ